MEMNYNFRHNDSLNIGTVYIFCTLCQDLGAYLCHVNIARAESSKSLLQRYVVRTHQGQMPTYSCTDRAGKCTVSSVSC